jgi:WS/DGAT/MGAT family acyltransferase
MDRMSPLDAWFLQLERSNQQLHVGSALLFAGPGPTHGELCAAISARLDRAPRYRQVFRRIAFDLGRPVWVDDEHFRIEHHVHRATLPAPGSESQLRELAGHIMSEPLDLDRPLWEMWLVDGLSGDRWALLNKSHHALMDGVSGTGLIGVLLDHRRETQEPPPSSWQAAPVPSTARLAASSVRESVAVSFQRTAAMTRALAGPTRLLRNCTVDVGGLAELGRKAVQLETILDGRIGPNRSWRWARSELDDVKTIKNTFGGTVNDVVLAVITGAFRTFLLSRGEDLDRRSIRTMVPVSLRRPGQPPTLGNQLSAMFADLPVGIADPVQRLRTVTDQLDGLKSHGMVAGVETILDALELLPSSIFAVGARIAARLPQRSISTVTTNVPGPQLPLYLLGHRMLEMFPYIPLALGMRVTIGIMSYDGHLAYGVTGDSDKVPDLDVLRDGIDAATRELLRAAVAVDSGRSESPSPRLHRAAG